MTVEKGKRPWMHEMIDHFKFKEFFEQFYCDVGMHTSLPSHQ